MTYFPISTYRLAKRDANHTGLICDQQGVSLGPIQLIERRRNASGGTFFCAVSRGKLANVLAIAYGTNFDLELFYRADKLQMVARALTEGQITQATLGAVYLYLPELSEAAVQRLKTFAKYDQNEPRDEHGRWTIDGNSVPQSPQNNGHDHPALTAETPQERSLRCFEECSHLMPSPSGDLQTSEFRKCYRECTGSLG